MTVTGTHIAYLHTCHRKLWLFASGVQMEHTSELVAEGRLIGETSYGERAEKFTEIEVDGIKIDFFDAKRKVIHEVKKSPAVEQAHIAQVKYYIYRLAQRGLDGVTAILEYPRLKTREVVTLQPEEFAEVEKWERQVTDVIAAENCPPVIRSRICKTCSYFDFCYSNESELP